MEKKEYEITGLGKIFCYVYEIKEISKYILLISLVNLLLYLPILIMLAILLKQ